MARTPLFFTLLALMALNTDTASGRALLGRHGASASEAALLAQQQAELAALVQQGQADIAQQAASEAAKAQQAADRQVAREAQQAADQAAQAAQQFGDQATADQQAALEEQARQAEREARRAARDAARAAEEQAAQQASDPSQQPSDGSAAQQLADTLTAQAAALAASDPGSKAARKAAKKARRARKAAKSAAYSDSGSSSTTSSSRSSDSGSGSAGNVYTTYHYYSPAYETSSLYCADVFQAPGYNKKSLLDRPWTAYCNDAGLGPMSQSRCGQSLCVTNPATGQTVKMVVVDLCGNTGIDMDPLGFNQIDGNGAGVRDGHLMTNIRWC